MCIQAAWGRSSNGRTSALQAESSGFKSLRLHSLLGVMAPNLSEVRGAVGHGGLALDQLSVKGSNPTGLLAETNESMTQHGERACEELHALLNQDGDLLPRAKESLESEYVIMDRDGNLKYRSTSAPEGVKHQLKEDLAKKRKKLVLGLGEYDRHTLQEANEIIREEWRDFVYQKRTPVGKVVTLIREQF